MVDRLLAAMITHHCARRKESARAQDFGAFRAINRARYLAGIGRGARVSTRALRYRAPRQVHLEHHAERNILTRAK